VKLTFIGSPFHGATAQPPAWQAGAVSLALAAQESQGRGKCSQKGAWCHG
jgi:hypothetical protein